MFHSLLRFKKPQTIIEVGAYTGDDDLIAACRRFGHRLFLFEPNPKRVAELRQKAGDSTNIEVIPAAVSNFDGSATFKIAVHDDCSSLQDFDPHANATWVHDWHPYKRFDMVDRIEVEVMRLDTFLRQRAITTVDLLEIDAQGEDLRVVESLGDRIKDVKKIQIEVNIHSAPLYQHSFRMDEAVALFAAHQFEKHVEWKQSLNREANIIFRNRRVYPYAPVNAVTARVEQWSRATYIAWVKLPRVLAVTWMMMRRKMGWRA